MLNSGGMPRPVPDGTDSHDPSSFQGLLAFRLASIRSPCVGLRLFGQSSTKQFEGWSLHTLQVTVDRLGWDWDNWRYILPEREGTNVEEENPAGSGCCSETVFWH